MLTRSLRRSALLTTFLLMTPGMVACGGLGKTVRPASIESGDASLQGPGGGANCTEETLKGKQSPFVVNASDGLRGDLEAAINQGLVMVRYSCDGIQIVDDCRLEGSTYAYAGLSRKSKLLEMKDAVSAKANLGINLTSDIQAQMAAGRSLFVQYVMIGKRTTTVRAVSRDQLVGSECGQVTHYVRSADLGAFVMQTAESVEGGAKVDLFTSSGEAEAGSSAMTRISDGNHESCQELKAESPLAGCKAVIRVSLKPVKDGDTGPQPSQKAGTEVAIGCPEGFVYSGDLCVPAKSAETFLCDENDFAQCDEQCNKGDEKSCGRLASMLLLLEQDSDVARAAIYNIPDDFQLEDMNFFNQRADLFKEACYSDEPDACTLAGVGMMARAMKKAGPDATPESMDKAVLNEVGPLMSRGCAGGEPYACELLGQMFAFNQHNDEMATLIGLEDMSQQNYYELLANSCVNGNGAACLTLSEAFITAEVLPQSAEAAGEFAGYACQGGQAEGCVMTAALILGSEICNDALKFYGEGGDDEDQTLSGEKRDFYKKLCEAAGPSVSSEDLAMEKVKESMGFFEKACSFGDDIACDMAQDLREHMNGQ